MIDPTNAQLLEELYNKFRSDPESVDPSWKHFFEGMEFAFAKGPEKEHVAPSDLKIYNLIFAYRTFGHLITPFNPIDTSPITDVPQLRLEMLGFQESELGEMFPTCGLMEEAEATLSEIVATLRKIYCTTIGFEYMGMQRPEMERWLQERIEPCLCEPNLSIDEKQVILRCLNSSELFEIFLHTKYVGQKRFSLEGAETLIPILEMMVEKGAEVGMEEIVIGMAHRGRLNVLANILNKPFANVFHEFEDTPELDSFEGSGDVKYHKGYSADVKTSSGKEVHLSLTANPSHLESVDPVVEGQVRAKQILKGDDFNKDRIVPILVHGDAALPGQGVIYETMQLCNLPGYGVGGTLHVVINNQIGFTTLPKDGRSTRYCTDLARAFGAPVFHVNGEDPEACAYAAKLASEIRAKFHCDVFIDLNCHRKYGHNESDEPAFTQPLEYQMIREKKSARVIYRDDLIQQGVVEKEMAEALEKKFREALQKELDEVQTLQTKSEHPKREPQWETIGAANREGEFFKPVETAVPEEKLRALAEKFCHVPDDFHIHRKVKRMVDERLKAIEGDEAAINWGAAEHLAFASLLSDDIHIRLSGQDSRRGTFNHRHAMWADQEKERKYFPLSHLGEGQGRFDVFNSPLSEFAVLGFEFGYSLAYPEALVMWEAQFGDFSNGAQVIIDQYISTSEQKWGRYSGLALLLPHGYEGQGPEHSSARLERFLQLAGDNNMVIANATTPAQVFHLFRRQVLWPMRKPLILFTPKGLFGHPKCLSSLDELSSGTFSEILDDSTPPEKVEQLVLCSGRIFYDLVAEREARGDQKTAIVRLEQLYPLHEERLKEIASRYSGFERCLWVQEEPSNMGAWDFLRPILRELLPVEPIAVTRERSASPATGSPKRHKAQLAKIMEGVFGS